jgi:glycopeptide antibiotics resistance protein
VGKDGNPSTREVGRGEAAGTPGLPVARESPAEGRNPPDGISDEPLINTVHRMAAEIILAAFVTVLVYISFVPFDFTRHPPPRSDAGFLWGLAFTSFNLPDILANIALYTPLGALAYAVSRRRRLGRMTSGVLVLLSASLLSFLVEHGQYFVRSRVSSWVDVTANGLGILLGVVLTGMWEAQIRRVLMRAKRSVQRNWWLALAKAAVCIVLLVHLRPYDVVVDVYHTAAELRHAEVSPLAGWKGLPARTTWEVWRGWRYGTHELPRVRWEYALDRVANVAAYAAVIMLVAVGLAAQFSSRAVLYLWSGFVGISLAAMITVIRVFLISHGLDTAYFFSALLGWPLGCALAHAVLAGKANMPSEDPPRSTQRSRRSDGKEPSSEDGAQRRPLPDGRGSDRGPTRAPRALGIMAIGFALAMVIVYELVPFDFGRGAGLDSPFATRRVCLLPFKAHFTSLPNHAFHDISGELLRYAVIGVCLAMVLRQRRAGWQWRRQLWTAVAVTGAAAVVLECVHLVMATRQTDVTTVILAIAGGFAGAVAVRWASDYRASLSVVLADDLLTGQLIEGDTYKGLSAVSYQPSVKKTQDAEH